MQSAATRNARAQTAAIADSRVAPYDITPGIASMSAHQRPSSSRPTTDWNGFYGDSLHRSLLSIIVPETASPLRLLHPLLRHEIHMHLKSPPRIPSRLTRN